MSRYHLPFLCDGNVAPLVTEIKGQGGVEILLKEKGTNSFVIKILPFAVSSR